MTLKHLREVHDLCREVKALCAEVESAKREAEDAAMYFSAPKLTGALRRRSLDLTRALADLRR